MTFLKREKNRAALHLKLSKSEFRLFIASAIIDRSPFSIRSKHVNDFTSHFQLKVKNFFYSVIFIKIINKCFFFNFIFLFLLEFDETKIVAFKYCIVHVKLNNCDKLASLLNKIIIKLGQGLRIVKDTSEEHLPIGSFSRTETKYIRLSKLPLFWHNRISICFFSFLFSSNMLQGNGYITKYASIIDIHNESREDQPSRDRRWDIVSEVCMVKKPKEIYKKFCFTIEIVAEIKKSTRLNRDRKSTRIFTYARFVKKSLCF